MYENEKKYGRTYHSFHAGGKRQIGATLRTIVANSF
jgi:hypothetical protein